MQELNLTENDVFEQEISRRIDSSDGTVSLFLVDMSDISRLFARSGRDAQVGFLNTVAKLLARVCREKDIVCRIGDSAFGVIFEGLSSSVMQQLAAEKIVRLYTAAVREMDATYQADIRIGIASYPDDAPTAHDLLHFARLASDAAATEHEPYLIYSSMSVATTKLKWNLQDDLAAAIKGKAFDVYYQPKVSVSSGRVVGAEALVRWENGSHGFVPPDLFIPLANELGLINELTQVILTTALRNADEWPGATERPGVSVNLEARTLRDIDIDRVIASTLSIWNGGDCELTLEITESALVADSKKNFDSLNRLRALGVGISIDDFGTGYSSLSYFQNIPATELKIDKSFTQNMCESKRTRQLVETIVSLAHKFDLNVVAEGVETEEQLELLKSMNCDTIQGFLISKALPHDEFCEWLKARPVVL